MRVTDESTVAQALVNLVRQSQFEMHVLHQSLKWPWGSKAKS